MEQFFEEELLAKTPQNRHLTASTPRIQGGCSKATFPTNITPVAVKQLFSHTSGRYLSEFTWTSSLATGFHSEVESLLDIQNKDMTSSYNPGSGDKCKSSANELSASLFSSWVEDGESAERMDQSEGVTELGSSGITKLDAAERSRDSPVLCQPVDPLSDLLRTPPSLKCRRFVAPKKRTTPDSTGDILSDLMNVPSKRPRTGLVPLSTKDVPPCSDLSFPPPAADSLGDTDSAFFTPSKLELDLTSPSCSLPTSSGSRGHRSAFKHTSRVDSSHSVPVHQYKPVRPTGAGRAGFFYPTKQSASKSELVTAESSAESAKQQRPIKPRRLTKFTAPSKMEETAHVSQSETFQQTASDSGFTSPTLRLRTPLPADLFIESSGCKKLSNTVHVEPEPAEPNVGDTESLSDLNDAELQEFSSMESSLLWEDIQLPEESLPTEESFALNKSHHSSVADRSPNVIQKPMTPILISKAWPGSSAVADFLNKFCKQSIDEESVTTNHDKVDPFKSTVVIKAPQTSLSSSKSPCSTVSATATNSHTLSKMFPKESKSVAETGTISKPVDQVLSKTKVSSSSVKAGNSLLAKLTPSKNLANYTSASDLICDADVADNTNHSSKPDSNTSILPARMDAMSTLSDLVQLSGSSANSNSQTSRDCDVTLEMSVTPAVNGGSKPWLALSLASTHDHMTTNSPQDLNLETSYSCLTNKDDERIEMAACDQEVPVLNSINLTNQKNVVVQSPDLSATDDTFSQKAVRQIAIPKSNPQMTMDNSMKDSASPHASYVKVGSTCIREEANMSISNLATSGISTGQDEEIKASKTNLDAIKRVSEAELSKMATECSLTEKIGCDLVPTSVGFCTAGGKAIKVSNSSLQAVQGIFDSSESTEGESGLIAKPIAESDSAFHDGQSEKAGDYAQTAGFSTASGKKINVSGTSLLAVKDLFDGNNTEVAPIVDREVSCNLDDKAHAIAFTTALGNNISISRDSIRAAKGLFGEDQMSEVVKSVSSTSVTCSTAVPPGGFSTAGGRRLSVSEHSLLAVKSIFADMEPSESAHTCDLEITPGVSTGTSSSSVPPVAFSTAGGKPIAISDSSLCAAKSLFEDSGSLGSVEGCGGVAEFSKTDSGPHAVGFSTARGNDIKISNASLNAVKGLFGEDQPSLEIGKSISVEKKSPIVGFSTARGDRISISDTSLRAVQRIFHSADPSECGSVEESIVSSSISQKDMLNVSKIDPFKGNWQKIKLPDDSCKPPELGFSTTGGKEIQVSKSSLHSVKSIFDESDNPTSVVDLHSGHLTSDRNTTSSRPLTIPPIGFSTASGAQIQISTSSLKTVRSIFNPEKLESQTQATKPTTGFSTALGNTVNVSASGLQAAKALFSDNDTKLLPDESSFGELQILDPARSSKGSRNALLSSLPVQLVDSSTESNSSTVLPSASGSHGSESRLSATLNISGVSPMIGDEQDSLINCRKVPEVHSPLPSPAITDIPSSCVTPPVKRRVSTFKSHSPLSITPIGLARNRSITNKAYWTTPSNSCKKFTYGNKPFKPHTPDREALASRLSKVHTPARTSTTTSSVVDETNQPSEVAEICDSSIHSVPATTRTYTADTKPASLKKPTNYMMSIKCKNKKTTLKELGPPTSTDLSQVREEVREITSSSACTHIFSHVTDVTLQAIQKLCTECDITEYLSSTVCMDSLYSCFQLMEGVDPALISREWFSNHYRWIVWKCARLERSYVDIYSGVCNPLHVLKHMKYRYEREVDLSHRSALRKIYEGDDVASKTMVLLVSAIKLSSDDDSSAQPVDQMELSDGWYSIKASYDPELSDLIDKGVIREGTKLVVSGAQRCGAEQDCSPLSSMASDVYLKISTNSVRKAKYWAKLGYTPNKMVMSLNSLLPLGGAVPCLNILISAVYPLVYMEKSQSGTVFRNEMKERKVRKAEAIKRDKLIEQAMNKENEMCGEVVRRGKRRHYTEQDVRQAGSGEELLSMVESAVDPDVVQQMMTERQREKMFVHQQAVVSEKTASIQSRVKSLLPSERSVTPMLKVRVTSMHALDRECKAWTILTVWRPTHEMMSLLKEGSVFNAYHLSASQLRGQKVNAPVLLSANKRSMFERVTVSKELLNSVYTPRQVLTPSEIRDNITTKSCAIEFNTAGVIVGWETPNDNLTVVFIADSNRQMLALNFWGGLKAHGYTEVVKEGILIYCTNIQKSSTLLRYTLPNLTVTEVSAVSTAPNTAASLSTYVKGLSTLHQEQRNELVRDCQRRLVALAQTSRYKRKSQQLKSAQTNANPYSRSPAICRSSVQSQSRLPDGSNLMMDSGSRQALVKQFRNPIVSGRSTASPGDTHNAPREETVKVDSEEEVSDSELLACISQS